MDKCLVCCQPVGRKLSNTVKTNVWEAALKVLRKAESWPVGDVSAFQKCHLCEVCLNFANRSCELIRTIKALQSELTELGGKLRSFLEKSITLAEKVQESYIYAENTVWVEARILLEACTGNARTDQVVEIQTWQECPTHSSNAEGRDRVEKCNEDDEDEPLHSSQISDRESKDTRGEKVFEPVKVSSSAEETLVGFAHVEETGKPTQFRTLNVQGFVLKDLEIRVERLTQDFVSKATRRNSRPRIAISDAESSDEDSDPDYNYASDQSADNSSVDQNDDSGRIQNDEIGRYRCALCGDRFGTYKLFLEHREQKHPANGAPLSCFICGKTYNKEASFKCHLYLHSTGLSCKTCGKKFRKKDELQKHEKDRREGRQCGKPWCEICKLNFSSGIMLFEHRKSVHKDTNQHGQFMCDKCGKTFQQKIYLKKHKTTHENGKYDCDLCSLSFPSRLRLRAHKRRGHRAGAKSKSARLGCVACNSSFDTRAALLSHIKTCSISQDSNGSHECSVCGKICTSRYQLLKHVVCHKPGELVCEVCGKNFVKHSRLRKHLATHTKEKLYTCEMCGKHVIQLKPHLQLCQEKRASEEEKTFKCSHCDKSFLLQESLSYHEKYKHLNEGRFECEVCHKRFTLNFNLVQHRRRAHFPEERLPCTMCSATFILPQDLNWHMQYQHFGYRDKCNICGYEGISRNAYRMHMLLHRVGSQHECDVCGKQFIANSQLVRHRITHKDSV